ncbi:tripartite tricarboxylate transporter substrate binding protein [Cupriavidus sp. AcVe19-6a]|uniref:Bug family tripartite tricarboxylate transporter substrate binding protein n=1 Tax=Cupriavidus sp. AcVe19-6a TaxID=2821358 RepID=UPI001AE9C087|nr:tripartite tricarboxylate transporter substrate binding protein [Cupriavidus sp. AcVe19-6a]MBP0637998.1 tripartite tricarboxylate transporter substrate binding protein [Cupriavidus sp. AcVe19-6a]
MKSLVKKVVVVGVAALANVAYAQGNWPSKPITFVVPSAPGGSTDFIARQISDPLSKALGQAVIIENRPGGAGNIGAEVALRNGGDGYTFLVQYSGYHVGNPALFPGKMRWNPERDYKGVAMLMRAPHVIVVGKGIPVSNLKELIDYGKKKPQGLSYASSGPGSIQHIAGEVFHEKTKLPMTHVAYKGSAPAMTDVISGQVDVFITTPPTVMGHLQSGNVKVLAYTAPKRHPALPNIPTSAEAGLPGYEVESWFALYAPAATPKPVIDKLSEAVKKVLESDPVRSTVNAQGAYAEYMNPAQLDAFTKKELAVWAEVIQTAKIKPE